MKFFKKFVDEKEPKRAGTSEIPYPFSNSYTYGRHLYYRESDVVEVIFENKLTNEKKMIVNEQGEILNFPGVVQDENWTRYWNGNGDLSNLITFRTSFEVFDNEKYIMLWEIQPDGAYWSDDDGFGAEKDVEIILYAFIDTHGNFMGPFRVYKVGIDRYLKRE